MKFNNFLKDFRENAVIDSASFALLDEKLTNIRRQVSGWVKKGYLIQLKKGIYVLGDTFRKVTPSLEFIANYLVTPSYLSREYALGYYDLIPERVTVYTSITTKKTQIFTNTLGRFDYSSVKESLFFGFAKSTQDNQNFLMALPEKAILDFFYLREDVKGKSAEFEAFRFQNLDIIKHGRLREFSQAYPRRVRSITRAFLKFVKEERRMYKRL